MQKQVLLLSAAQALFQTASAVVLTIGALAGRQVASDPSFATAPIAAMFLGTVVTTIPASRLMARAGRRTGFIAGALSGVLGGLVGAWGVHADSLLLLSLGTLLVGVYQAFAQSYRFAASELSDDRFRPRAISLVLAGGVIAAVLGPVLAARGGPLLHPPYVASFLILAVVSLIAAGLLTSVRVPAPAVGSTGGERRPLIAIMRQPAYGVALLGAATGSGVMVLAMTATPLAMAHHQHGLAAAATVIQAHVLGMFLPSFFAGSLIVRFGVIPIMLSGAVLLAGHVVLSLSGTSITSFASALLLLGIGWNFLYVGGTTMLTATYRPVERERAQAANDLVIYVVGLVAALSAGVLHQALGWRLMNIVLLPWLLVAVVAVAWYGATGRAAESAVLPGTVPPAPRSD